MSFAFNSTMCAFIEQKMCFLKHLLCVGSVLGTGGHSEIQNTAEPIFCFLTPPTPPSSSPTFQTVLLFSLTAVTPLWALPSPPCSSPQALPEAFSALITHFTPSAQPWPSPVPDSNLSPKLQDPVVPQPPGCFPLPVLQFLQGL